MVYDAARLTELPSEIIQNLLIVKSFRPLADQVLTLYFTASFCWIRLFALLRTTAFLVIAIPLFGTGRLSAQDVATNLTPSIAPFASISGQPQPSLRLSDSAPNATASVLKHEQYPGKIATSMLAFASEHATDDLKSSNSIGTQTLAITEPKAEPEGVSFKNGIQFNFPSTSSKAHIGTLIQQDCSIAGQNSAIATDLQDSAFFRRARIKFDGTIDDFFEWDFDCELLASSSVTFDDLWIGVKSLPKFGTIRAGHVKLPQGLESITSNRYLTFVERSLVTDALYREYGPGLLAFNNWAEDSGVWELAVYRTDAAGDGIDIGDGEYALGGRLTAVPISSNDEVSILHFGVSASIRDAEFDPSIAGPAVRIRSRPEYRTARSSFFLIDTGPIPADSLVLLGIESALVEGPFSIQAEFTAAGVTNRVSSLGGGNTDDAWFTGGYVQMSYFLTGEHRTYDRRLGRFSRVIPNMPLEKNHLRGGAWEAATRYSWLDLNSQDILGGNVSSYSLGLNWYCTSVLRMQFNYMIAEREQVPADGFVHGLVIRLSLDL